MMELCAAKWSEVALDDPAGPTWRIRGRRMKKDRPHAVPLSRQAVECFKELQTLSAGGEYVFPALGRIDRHLSGSALNAAFERIGYAGRVTPHRLRTTASTLLNEQGIDRDAIELQLAQLERDEVRGAYKHADKLPERRRMLQAWADFLDALCAGANLVPMRRIA